MNKPRHKFSMLSLLLPQRGDIIKIIVEAHLPCCSIASKVCKGILEPIVDLIQGKLLIRCFYDCLLMIIIL